MKVQGFWSRFKVKGGVKGRQEEKCKCRSSQINARPTCGVDSSQYLAPPVHTSPRCCCLGTYCNTWRPASRVHTSPLVQSSPKEADALPSVIFCTLAHTLCNSKRKCHK